ncbi:paramyosin-like [Palaemon carinicauda]|uniref:paramyosin-like n=1 Tax=Palaemon carinicauda TaxID=392227 RepID=UPI0035B5C921
MTKWATIKCGLNILLLTTTVVGNDFTCETAGVFKKPGSCNEYYKCIRFQDTFFMGVLRCKGSDLFDENLKDCVREHTLTSPAECRTSRSEAISPPFEDRREKGHEATEEDGTLDSKQTIANRSLDARNFSMEIIPNANFSDNPQVIPSLCDQMKSAEEYFRLVAGSPLLPRSSEYQTKYNEIVQQYNMDIKKAHNNTYLWRHGRSIPLILKRSHKEANEYEHNFQRKFDIYKEQIEAKASETPSPDVLWRIEAQIQELTESVRLGQEALSTTKVVALQNFLEAGINLTKSKIDRLQSIKNPNSEERLLGVLVNFLSNVTNDATEVERQVTQGLEKMETLLENVQFEAQDYDKLGNETSTGLKNLEEESDKITNELRPGAKLQEAARTLLYQLQLRLKEAQVRKEIDEREKKLQEFLVRKRSLCWRGGIITTFINKHSTVEEIENVCNIILRSKSITIYQLQLRLKEAQVRKEIDEREKKLEEFLDRKKRLCWIAGIIRNFINKHSTVEEIENVCNIILRSKSITILDVDAEDARLNELHKQMKAIKGNQEELVKGLSSLIARGTILSDTLPRDQRLAEIQSELDNLKFHDAQLKKLQLGVSNAERAILILQQEFRNLQVKFNSIVTQLQEMTDSANAALNGGSQVGLRLSIETELKEQQTTLQNLVLENVNECSALNPSDVKT